MKKLNLIILLMAVTASSVLAGGLVTNTNQSAAWARTLTREASLGVDAVYFNPAGLAQLSNGLHLSISNQSIFQTRTITNGFAGFNNPPNTYEADLTAPLFPSVYGAYKMDKLTFSAGFNIIGGGGSADFKAGLPSIEMGLLALAPTTNFILSGVDAAAGTTFANTSGYDMDAAFEGSSMYMGFQAGVTYAINDMISVALGGRYVSAKNTYEGSLDAMINASPEYGGELTYPGDYVRWAAGQVGMADDPALNGAAAVLDGVSKGVMVDVTQTGSGFTPIIGVNLHLTDMINIAAKYEHRTKIELTNNSVKDLPGDYAMFPDGEKSRADLPGMFSLGAQLKPIDKLTASVGFNYYLDKPAYYGDTIHEEETVVQVNNESTIDNNSYSISASLEYKILDILGVSAGFSMGSLGVNDTYQSDMNYGLKSKSVAGGVFVNVSELITVNAGFVYTMYDDYEKNFTTPLPYMETYGKKTALFAIGVDINL